MTAQLFQPPDPDKPRRLGFAQDFRRFFVRGLAAIAPTLVTIWLLLWVWDFLWANIGRQIIIFIRQAWFAAGNRGWIAPQTPQYILYHLDDSSFGTRALGVLLSVILIYFIGVFVGNLIGRTAWLLVERALLRIPLVRAIYPAVKQITDFVLADRSRQFQASRVVAVQPHEQNIWSIGLVTNSGQWRLSEADPEDMVTVFIPSTPTSFSGYVLVVPRKRVVELPMTVEEAFRLLVSGGVIAPNQEKMLGQEMSATLTPAAPDAVGSRR
ncbi:MAG: DUF502 domain-containing protein [Tepidisphaeraceae bacterium]